MFGKKPTFFSIIADQKDSLKNLITELKDEDRLIAQLYRELTPHEGNIRLSGEALDKYFDNIKATIYRDRTILDKIISKLKELLRLIEDQESKASSFDGVPDMMESIKDNGMNSVFGNIEGINKLSNEIDTLFSNLAQSLKETKTEVKEVDVDDINSATNEMEANLRAESSRKTKPNQKALSSGYSIDPEIQSKIGSARVIIFQQLLNEHPTYDFEMAFIMGEKSFMLSNDQMKKNYNKNVDDALIVWKEFIQQLYGYLDSEEINRGTLLEILELNTSMIRKIKGVENNITVHDSEIIVRHFRQDLQNIESQIKKLVSQQNLTFEEQTNLKSIISDFIITRYADLPSYPDTNSVVVNRAYKEQVIPLLKRARTPPFERNYGNYITAYQLLYNITLNSSDPFYKEELEKLKKEITREFETAITNYLESSVGKAKTEKERNVNAAQQLFSITYKLRIYLFNKYGNKKSAWKQVVEELTPVLLEEMSPDEIELK